MPNVGQPQPVQRELEVLRRRVSEAEETLDAIRCGSVDALVVRTPRGEQIFTLKGADQTYRALVEAMNEGAVTLNHQTVSYCNLHFARMTRAPLEKVLGSSIFAHLSDPRFRRMLKELQRGDRRRASVEAALRTSDGGEIPVLVSGSRFPADGRLAVCLVVADISERKAAERALGELSRQILNAQEGERKRVARDLHDSVNQLLSSAKFRLGHALSAHNGTLHQNVQQAFELLEKAIAEVRLISHGLRPSELDDLGLPAALRSLLMEFQQRTGILAEFRSALPAPLPAEVKLNLYRIAQEALSNIEKHSQATRARLDLVCSNGDVVLSVRDNGKGFPGLETGRRKAGWGLKNIKERAALLGGILSLEPGPGKGTRLSIQLPLGGRRTETRH